jgi:glycosyltransferase involved in cell wall biosynthesis
VHSTALAEELTDLGEVRGAIEVVPHGLNVVPPEPLPERPALLFFGRISHYKGLDTLLDAMPLVWEELPEATLTIAGEGPLPEREALADPRVTLRHEHVPEADVPGLFAAATCAVLPYRQASQSGVGSEAKRFGRAIVATSVGGLPELVDEGCGRLVAPEDPEALAAAVVEVAGTPGLAAELGHNAAASGEESSWHSVAARTLDAYRRVLA